jgi:acyl-CoA reductase-like NAD-dependent aldehyde dehydrogenase
MKVSEAEIQKLVEQVLTKVTQQGQAELVNTASTTVDEDEIARVDGVFSTVDEAVEAAEKAFEEFSKISLSVRKTMIEKMRETSIQHAKELAQIAVQETGLGRVEDKTAKNLLAAKKTPGVEDLVSTSYTGDHGLTLVENAPMGLMGSITPSTNPGATIINNSISMVAAGNAVVFNPHPSAKRVSLKAMQLLNRAIVEAGGPENLLTSVANPSLQTSEEVMNHPTIRALVVTGGGLVVKAAMKTGKKVIAAGPGNPPVVVDETADLTQAGRDIVLGASFDNNVLCTAEKEVFVVSEVANKLKQEMVKQGAYELKGFQLEKLLKIILLEKDGYYMPNRDFIGKDASILLDAIGVKADPSIKLIIAETAVDHPLVTTEMLMPIIPIVKAACVCKAIEYAVKAEKGNRHTAIMHSQNVTNMTKMAKQIQATIFVKNGPSYAGLGFNGEGFTTLTIAGPTGEGLTSARTFTRQRRCVLADGLRII